MWLICSVILECKISRFLVHFQRPKQRPGKGSAQPKYVFAQSFFELRKEILNWDDENGNFKKWASDWNYKECSWLWLCLATLATLIITFRFKGL